MTLSRSEIEALLVFLANDTLQGDERAEVEAAVAADPQLQGELAAMRAIRDEMQAQAPGVSPGEFGLARLMRDIDREVAAPAPATRSRFWQGAAAAAVALLFVQSAGFLLAPDTVIELAGGGSGQVEGAALTVAFNPAASEGAIRALLLQLDLVIVDGPSALGLYTVVAPDDAAREQALTALQAAPALVDSAETVE